MPPGQAVPQPQHPEDGGREVKQRAREEEVVAVGVEIEQPRGRRQVTPQRLQIARLDEPGAEKEEACTLGKSVPMLHDVSQQGGQGQRGQNRHRAPQSQQARSRAGEGRRFPQTDQPVQPQQEYDERRDVPCMIGIERQAQRQTTQGEIEISPRAKAAPQEIEAERLEQGHADGPPPHLTHGDMPSRSREERGRH